MFGAPDRLAPGAARGASIVAINSLPVGDPAAAYAIDDGAVNMNNVRPSSPPSIQV